MRQPGLAFFQLGGVRLLLEHSHAPKPGDSVLYFRVPTSQDGFQTLRSRGVTFDSAPQLIHRDDAGSFGPAGAEEWMAFFRDPDGNRLALAARLPGSRAG